MTKNEIIEMLRGGVYTVTFTKVNGEERSMPCTLMESFLPLPTKNDPITQKKVREINDKVVAAWCVNKRQFRSFRVDNVIKIEKYTENNNG
jgi:Na+-translocating ferredoxin:NAD+ oxidoreductase RnfG subunit